jgi:hypothetical protein
VLVVALAACDDDYLGQAPHEDWNQKPPRVHVDAGTSPLTSSADFYVPGTQSKGVPRLLGAQVCQSCHMTGDPSTSPAPYDTWSASLMSIAARDPLFFAQLTTANQDAPGVGTYCLRCHAPAAIPSGHADDPTGASLRDEDLDGVTCHLCHSMIDPNYVEGTSPIEDVYTLSKLADVPTTYGNAQFVLDLNGLRRGPYTDAKAMHPVIVAPFIESSNLCGTCHDVGNPALSRQADGTYKYNAPYERSPSADPHAQFPLERTYTEWKLSAFASGGVDMGGRFGGQGATVVSTCQDCHMPIDTGRGCAFGDVRTDLARHDFSGAASWVLEIAQLADSTLDPSAIARGRANAESMLKRAADITLTKDGGTLHVRVTNQSGHKLPTGHIEGRRMWVDVVFFNSTNAPVEEIGAWDPNTGNVDAKATIFEMKLGLSADAAKATGLPEGETAHMSLADVITKDTRIPPRGYVASTFAMYGAPVVGAPYADGQNWADLDYAIPPNTTRATATLVYETVTPEYVHGLKNGNHTDQRGAQLELLWRATDRDPPIPMAQATMTW